MEQYDVLAVMKKRLSETGLYTVDGSTLVDGELAAYAAGFSPLFAAYGEVAKEAMLLTAEDWGFACWEGLLGSALRHLTVEDRRQMLLARLAMTERDGTVAGLTAGLLAFGVGATITEDPDNDAITVTVTDVSKVQPKTQAAVKERAAQVLPAHLAVTYDFSQVPNLFVE